MNFEKNTGWHWTCNNKIFLNKIDSVKESVSSCCPIHYHAPSYYTESSVCYEPMLAWEEILRRRAQNIRDSYSYLNLWFSGGCDSTRMLKTFVDNKIHLDEITMFKCGIGDADFEIDFAMQIIKQISQSIPHTKITIHDYGHKAYDKFYNTANWQDQVKISTPYVFRAISLIKTLGGHWRDGHSKINIIGKDKPSLVFVNGKWYCYFLDVNHDKNDFDYDNNILFFYSDDVHVHAKQCHMLKRHIESTYTVDEYNSPTKIKKIPQKVINYGSGRLEHSAAYFLPKVIALNTLHQDSTGNSYRAYNHKEQRAITHMINNNEQLLQQYQKGCDRLVEQLGGSWFNNGRPEMGSIGVHSKFYCLNSPEIKTVDDLFPNGFFS